MSCSHAARTPHRHVRGRGKTTVLDELRRRGHRTVDTDYDRWERPDGTWDEERMAALLAAEPDVVVRGTTEQHQSEIAGYTRTVKPTPRAGATVELDGARPVAELADVVEALVTAPRAGS